MEMTVLTDVLIILAVAVAVLFVSNRLKIPVIVGFLITGVLAGPHGFKLVGATHEVSTIAEIGVVLLLFTIGIELSLKDLMRIKRTIFIGGPLQVATTTIIVALVGAWFDLTWAEALFLGMIAALSSTAITVRSYQEEGEADSPHARAVVSISIFQDIATVPMLLSIPLLAGTAGSAGSGVLRLFVYGIGMIIFVFVASRWIAPFIFEAVARTRNREMFLLVVVLMCLGIAWFSSVIGLSLALGAFLAGLIVSESDYSYHAMGSITPFRDLFASLFFVTVGMLLDLSVVLEYPLLVLSLAAGIIILKALIVIPISLIVGHPLRTAILTGIGLSNVGEFAFILSSAGLSAGLLSQHSFQIFLAVSAVTMAAAPFLIRLGPILAQSSLKLPVKRQLDGAIMGTTEVESLSQHLIIVGFGVNGANLARASQAVSIPYVILEMNPETVKQARSAGERIYFGDAAQAHVWHALNVSQARIVVIAISDPDATRRSVALVRSLNDNVHIIARTRYLNEIDTLSRLGANEVIPEEFETAVEIFTLVLRHYLIPESDINEIVQQVRSDNYEIFRAPRSDSALRRIESDLASVQLTTVRVAPDAAVVGKSLAELRLRSDFAVTVLMIKRGDDSQVNPEPDSRFEPGDTVVLVGEDRRLTEVSRLFH